MSSVVNVPSSLKDGESNFRYTINTTWDDQLPPDSEEITVSFHNWTSEVANNSGLLIEIDAPLYNDPIVPPHLPVGSTDQLWNYEVVEVFFLSESEEIYLEAEFAPKGHYLLLTLDTNRTILEYELPLDQYTTQITEDGRWHGKAVIPYSYFPKNVNKFNAYAIHKSDPNRVYMSLFPTPTGKYTEPNFHRLEYFQPIDLSPILEP